MSVTDDLGQAFGRFNQALSRLSTALLAFAEVLDEERAPREVDLLIWDLQATGELDPFA